MMDLDDLKTIERAVGQLSTDQVAWRSTQIQDRSHSPSPIQASWIVSGNPMAGARTLFNSADGDFSATLWHCSEGEFVWQYRSDEIIHILEGETYVDGRRLTAGDVAFFPHGTSAHWRITLPIRKLAIHRSLPMPPLWKRIAAKARRMAGRGSKG